jgi:FtsP/CotA-like multicopper oxidase with cupredoxin domain
MSERTSTRARRYRRIALAGGLAVFGAMLVPGPASALPVGAPRIGMVCTPGTVSGSTHTFNLVAKTGYIDTPDGNSIFMWSYANADAPDSGHFQSPGPVLCVTQGETVTVNLTNNLTGEASSIAFPGQQGVTTSGGVAGLLAREATASGGSVSYTFSASQPGTYLYESGSDVAKQVEMGLYGALVVRPSSGANLAYDATTQFDPTHEYLLLLAEVDPDLHHAVEVGGTYDFNALRNRYFTINGRSFPDTILDNSSTLLPNQPYGALVRIQPDQTGSQPALLRMINVGALNHPFHPHGNHTVEIAKDGRMLLSPTGASAATEHFGETIGSGETEDFLLHWKDTDNFSPVTNPYPVTPPNYKNVTFKDSNTWYSGSPYLGYKGTLPTGVVSQNICGEWYFPLHSHALNEFANFDSGFGGMGTLLRVDPPGGCFASASSAVILRGVLKAGAASALGGDDSSYYQVNPKTTTRATGTLSSSATSMTVASAAGFPAAPFYIQIQSEDIQVTATSGTGNTTWTLLRGRLGSAAASHSNTTSGRTVTALSNDWYGTVSGVAAGAANLKVTYKGRNCANTTGTGCTAITTNLPQQTVKVCDWTVSGPAGCSSATSNGWVTLTGGPAQPQSVGSVDVGATWTLSGSASHYVGTGANKGQVRVLIQTQWWTGPPAPVPTAFSTQGNLLAVQYDAP